MIPYILHSGLILAACFSFYKVLLQKETFYQVNRFVLFGCMVLSFSLPLIPIPQQFSLQKTEITKEVNVLKPPSYQDVLKAAPLRQVSRGANAVAYNRAMINPEQAKTWVVYLYWFGVIAFSLNFLVQLVSLLVRAYCNPVIIDGSFRIVELPGDKAPCSFGNIIFINPEKYDWETYDQILQHEKIHIQQQHSIDILLAELVLIFQWFNPFAWLYRKELGNNLEFLTDDQLLRQGKADKVSYQMNLLKVSAPHFPLGLTTNYNQSLLKKRVIMMNAKKSNVNTTWKYLFLFPLFVIFACVLNKPVALAQSPSAKNTEKEPHLQKGGLETEGAWFATIKNDALSIQFKNDDDAASFNSSTFPLSEFKNIPKDKAGTFALTREAGTMEFTGKFEGNQGMGRYKFIADKGFNDYLQKEEINIDGDRDLMVFFMVDLKISYIQMLKSEGYSSLSKNDLIPLAALKIDAAYIQSLKQEGLRDLSLQDLIPLKSLGISSDYIREIRKAGYKNISASQLITFKSQGIDGKYIADMRSAARKEGNPGPREEISAKENESTSAKDNEKEPAKDPDLDLSADDLVAIKAMNISADYISSLKQAGYENLSNSDLIAMKAQGITGEYIRNFRALGYKNISPSDLISFKAQDITQDYIKSFEAIGYSNMSMQDIVSLKALGISPQYIKRLQDAGFKDVTLQNAIALKSQGITSNLVNQYKQLGFAGISLNDIIEANATGTTPSFIASMKGKGFNLKSIQKYIRLKTSFE